MARGPSWSDYEAFWTATAHNYATHMRGTWEATTASQEENAAPLSIFDDDLGAHLRRAIATDLDAKYPIMMENTNFLRVTDPCPREPTFLLSLCSPITYSGEGTPTISFQTWSVVELPCRGLNLCLEHAARHSGVALEEYSSDIEDDPAETIETFLRSNAVSSKLREAWGRNTERRIFFECQAAANVCESGSFELALTFSGYVWGASSIEALPRLTLSIKVKPPRKRATWTCSQFFLKPASDEQAYF